MLISHKHKFITIDIPKTATRSLRETFVPQNIIDIVGEPNLNADFYQHGTAQQCRNSLQKLNKNFSDYFSFVIVRNPWSRYYSFFKYFKEYAEKYKNMGGPFDTELWAHLPDNINHECLKIIGNGPAVSMPKDGKDLIELCERKTMGDENNKYEIEAFKSTKTPNIDTNSNLELIEKEIDHFIKERNKFLI